MDYKKEYEAMVQRAKELHEAGNFLTKKQMEIVCPELAESEDEKIRNGLIEFFSNNEERISGLDDKSILDWLEKQKEPHFTKRNALFNKCVANCDPMVMKEVSDKVDEILEKEQKPRINIDQLKSMMLQYLQEAANEKDDSDIEADTDKWARKILGYNFEQKPADLPAGFYYIDGKGNKYYSKEFRCSNELGGYVSLKVAEQKPSWSEEDEEMLDSIIKVVCGVGSQPNGLREKQVNWLKSLRPQPQWKPSEKEITAFENMLKGEFPDGIFPGVTLSALLAKLKKLHYNESIPSWKPSEEQISAVKHAYNSFPDYCPAKLGLKSLYEDLKKL